MNARPEPPQVNVRLPFRPDAPVLDVARPRNWPGGDFTPPGLGGHPTSIPRHVGGRKETWTKRERA